MPRNSEVHAARISKIREGFKGLNPKDCAEIIAMYDTLDEALASQLASRTEFSVSFFSKAGASDGEHRRQVARALLFVLDLHRLFNGLPLPPKPTDSDFQTLWQGDAKRLEEDLRGNVRALVQAARQVREIVGADVPKREVPKVGKVAISTEMQSLLDSTLRRKGAYGAAVASGQRAIGASNTAWVNAKVELTRHFSTELAKNLSNIDSLKTAGRGAYKEFEAFFAEQGKETEAKVELAKAVFGALESAPFPISVVGKIGKEVASALKVDTSISQARALGEREYFNSDVPLLKKASNKLAAVTDWADELRTLGVPAKGIPSGTSIEDAIDTAKQQTLAALIAVFNREIDDTYGSDSSSTTLKANEFFEAVRAMHDPSRTGDREALMSHVAVSKITQLTEVTKRSISGMGSLPLVDAPALQPFIELQLFATYMKTLAPTNELDSVEISDTLIRRLEGAPHKLVIRKTGSGQTDEIFARGKLPWADGHPRHVGAIALFFRWYSAKVNPFDIATGRTSAADVTTAMADTIKEIGQVIGQNKISRTFRNDTADWAKVDAALSRRR